MPSSSLQALLTRAAAALERGDGPEAAQMLAPAVRSSALTRDEELALRSMLAEAWLLQDDLDQAASALGRPPDTFRDTIPSGRLSTLWRLHGRLAWFGVHSFLAIMGIFYIVRGSFKWAFWA